LISIVVVMLVLVVLVPQANAGFTNSPTFDLKTSSSLAGATDAVYVLHFENLDQTEDAVGLSITLPAGYSVDQKFITDKIGITAMSAYGNCPDGTGQAKIVTTTTPGRFSMSAMGMSQGEVTVRVPTPSTEGVLEMTFAGTYTIMNRGCKGEITPVKGFFINPSTAGTYAWAPSVVKPRSGPAVTMEARSGFSQIVTIVGTTATTSATTTEAESPITTQTATSTTQVTTATSEETTAVQTTTHAASSETETGTSTITQPPAGAQLPMELLAAAVTAIVIIAVGAVLFLRRRK
jgi:hypothetical protein